MAGSADSVAKEGRPRDRRHRQGPSSHSDLDCERNRTATRNIGRPPSRCRQRRRRGATVRDIRVRYFASESPASGRSGCGHLFGSLPDRDRPVSRMLELRRSSSWKTATTFDLLIAPVTKQLGKTSVRMLAYNRSIPGPTLRVKQGSRVIINVTNEGDLEATVHWHGVRLDNRYDGTRRGSTADSHRRTLHLPARLPGPRRLLVPPAYPPGLRPGDGPLREHRGRPLRARLLGRSSIERSL